jgi:hypothetical protein
MAPDQERYRLEEMAETLQEAAAKFEELVRTSPTKLVEALWQLQQQDLRRILFTYVLIEQRRRTDRLDTEQPPSEQARQTDSEPADGEERRREQQRRGLSEEEAAWENEGGR